MKAVQVTKPGELRLIEMPSPVPWKNEVRIRVMRGGICGSDMHIYQGSNPFATYPRVPGHEFTGEVVGLGHDVLGFKQGDRVVVDPVLSCGHCYPCLNNNHNVCVSLEVIGVHRDGGFCEFVCVDAGNLHKIPDSLSWDEAVFVEPFSIGANITSRVGLTARDTVLVVGAGAIGLVAVQVAKLYGAKVLVCDIVGEKLAKARSMGADEIIDTGKVDLEKEVDRITGGQGVPVILDAATIPAMMESLLRIACPGGRVGILGFSKSPSAISQYEITRKELTVFGSRLNNHKFPQVIRWMAEKRLRPLDLVSSQYPAKEALQAFEFYAAHRDSLTKVLLDFEAL